MRDDKRIPPKVRLFNLPRSLRHESDRPGARSAAWSLGPADRWPQAGEAGVSGTKCAEARRTVASRRRSREARPTPIGSVRCGAHMSCSSGESSLNTRQDTMASKAASPNRSSTSAMPSSSHSMSPPQTMGHWLRTRDLEHPGIRVNRDHVRTACRARERDAARAAAKVQNALP